MAIPEIIEELAHKVRTEIYGRDVREAIATSMEATAEVAEWSREVAQQIIDGSFDEGELNTEIERKLNELEQQYAPQLTQVKEETQSNERAVLSIDSANATDTLGIVNYLGNTQNIHPKVLYFKNGWNGYDYWMAYTPYPQGRTSEENPSIAVSNDKINWTVPEGLTNPLDPAPVDGGYNSDTHLVYREDIDQLEIWWRQMKSDGRRDILRRTTKDGVNWTPREVVLNVGYDGEMYSPSVIFEDGKYKVWFCRRRNYENGRTDEYVMYNESENDDISTLISTNAVPLHIDWDTDNLRPWHLDVIHTDLGYEMVVSAYDRDTGSAESPDLWYVIQKEDGTFTQPKLILEKSKNVDAIDNRSIYRSSLLKIDGYYYLFYSCTDNRLNRWMSLAHGRSVFGLNGLKSGNKQRQKTAPHSTTLRNYDVSDTDVLYLTLTVNNDTIVESLTGGYRGKKLTIVAYGRNAKAVFKQNPNRLITPTREDFILHFDNNTAIDLVCTNDLGTEWRIMAQNNDRVITVSAPATLEDYEIGNANTILVTGSGELLIKSLRGTHVGQKVHVVMASSSATVKFQRPAGDQSRLLTPGFALEYEFDYQKLGVTMISTYNKNQFRVF